MIIAIKRMYRFANGFTNKLNLQHAKFIAKKIERSKKPLEYVATLQAQKMVSIVVLWKAISYLQNTRSPVYEVAIKGIEDEELRNLVVLRTALSSPSAIPSNILEGLVSFYKMRKKSIANESDYRRLLIALIVKKLPASQAYYAFSKAEMLDKINIHQVLKVLHKASLEGDVETFSNLKNHHYQKMTSAALVKVMYWEKRINNTKTTNYKFVESSFCQLDKALAREYVQYLLTHFEAIPKSKKIIDFQIEVGKLSRLKNMLEEAVQLQQPFSFVRLNDGEGYGFPDALPCSFDTERQELHWWGEVLPPALRNKIQEDFRRSLPEHDLVGIPSVFRFIDELSINRDYSIFNNALLCRLFTLCHGYLNIYDGRACITEGQINLYLFDREYITKLARLAQRVVFISGAKKEYLQGVFSELQHASYIELPTHRLLKTEKFSYSEAERPMPYVYEDYLEQIRELAGPGVVFFISAGFIGKIFAAEVAKKGGVALDVGQILMNIVANHVDA